METESAALLMLLITAVLTAVIHTITGPDHYLPFIAIAQSQHYSIRKTLLWTLICGIGHVGSALLLAGLFVVAAKLLTESQLEKVEDLRGSIAAYALIGMGAMIILHSVYRRWKHRPHQHRHVHLDGSVTIHTHDAEHDHPRSNEKTLSYWVLFIIFVLGPCEALFPLLTAAAVLSTASVVTVALVFSLVTILTMMAAVTLGIWGIQLFRSHWLERYAPELAGATVMLCGMAIAFLGW